MTEVIHVRFPGNWEALYVDGTKAASAHSVDVGDRLESSSRTTALS